MADYLSRGKNVSIFLIKTFPVSDLKSTHNGAASKSDIWNDLLENTDYILDKILICAKYISLFVQ